jgi:glutaredoxin
MNKSAILYRMATDKHICPYGLRAKDLLQRRSFSIDDRVLATRQQVDKVKSELDVNTTPQVIIDDNRIGGFDELSAYFGKKASDMSYFPVIALFGIAALLTAGLSFHTSGFTLSEAVMQFVGLSMVMLGLLKLQNIDGFVNGFLAYDLLAQRYVPYAFVYPFAEVLGGLLMVSSLMPFISVPLMLFIGGVGGISVFKAVYLEKRELECVCVGGGSNVPLGLVSFLENAVMFGAGIWMVVG